MHPPQRPIRHEPGRHRILRETIPIPWSECVPIVNKVSASVFNIAPKARGRQPSPEHVAMVTQISTIRSEKDVYEVLLTGEEKAATVRQQIVRAARSANVDIAIVRSPHGWYIGLMTPSRATRTRRRKAAPAADGA